MIGQQEEAIEEKGSAMAAIDAGKRFLQLSERTTGAEILQQDPITLYWEVDMEEIRDWGGDDEILPFRQLKAFTSTHQAQRLLDHYNKYHPVRNVANKELVRGLWCITLHLEAGLCGSGYRDLVQNLVEELEQRLVTPKPTPPATDESLEPHSLTILDVMGTVRESREKSPGNGDLTHRLDEVMRRLARSLTRQQDAGSVRDAAVEVAAMAVRIAEEGDARFPQNDTTE